jgi:quercetin dioxygenase-like cupin family protein
MTAPDDPRKRPYARPQPFGMLPDLVTAGAIDIDDPQGFWVPQAEGVWFRPLVLSVSQGFYVNLLRVRRAGVLSRHRHFGAVHAFVLRGRWRYLEHDWEATEGSYVFEPPGETHTLTVPDDCAEMVTLFTVHGMLTYVDPDGNAVGYDDVFTRIEKYRAHFEAVGLGADHVRTYMR